MAALDTPWLSHMSTPKHTPRGDVDGPSTPSDPPPTYAPPTYASFSTANLSAAASAAKRRSTILVHQKSPLLLATPPQITRALAYSHPFLLPLNKLMGLLTWTTGDPWESFILLAIFWAAVQYGDVIVRFAGPIVVVMGLVAGMYGRRYSPLSSSGWAEYPSIANKKDKKTSGASAGGAGGSHQRNSSELTSTRHQKTLDEIVDTVKVFTTRCNILLEPLLEMTDFLSTQRTATSATTKPALTTLFVRILAVTPAWIILTLPPLRIITTKRVVLVFGTLVLTWHSRVCRVSRTLLWRSATVRKLARLVTGLQFEEPARTKPKGADGNDLLATTTTKTKLRRDTTKASPSALTEALKRGGRSGAKDPGVRFSFIIYENQRRWLGLGWTNSLFAYERAAWTDEHNNQVPPKDEFELPEVEDGRAKWRWVEGSKWRVDGVPDMDEADYDTDAGKNGWIFYDNKWQNGRRGNDGWGRWTRRRKWYRDAELVEISDDAGSPPPPELPARPVPASVHNSERIDTASVLSASVPDTSSSPGSIRDRSKEEDDAVSLLSTSSKSARFRSTAPQLRRRTTGGTHRSRRTSEAASLRSNEDEGSLTPALELEIQGHQRDQGQWGIGDEAQMGLE
ncbi:Pex24p-domain-containing protein [Daldinia caldariorum]|uniref:Pex24p-domain-containing protein n=1 Tax=Daldinia caldariorum TaxID=326644 RepID=UPI0020087D0A|nr:Pex24p-domain-containing protein [Daldinia caldariorum]KAI1469014.1 Pex24p-domain-containing protein [Daldinia caldariorum]